MRGSYRTAHTIIAVQSDPPFIVHGVISTITAISFATNNIAVISYDTTLAATSITAASSVRLLYVQLFLVLSLLQPIAT